MDILDIHTHRIPEQPLNAIWNCMPKDESLLHRVDYCSVGIRPWYVTEANLSEQKRWVEEVVLNTPSVVAIGEAGLDKATDVPWELQLNAFEWQIEWADRLGLPLILHVVKAHNEVMEMKKKYRPRNRWIVHGFRGKRQLAEQYLREGISLSFGTRYSEDALRAIPYDKLFFETDESSESIYHIYEQAAKTLQYPYEELLAQGKRNIGKAFFNG